MMREQCGQRYRLKVFSVLRKKGKEASSRNESIRDNKEIRHFSAWTSSAMPIELSPKSGICYRDMIVLVYAWAISKEYLRNW